MLKSELFFVPRQSGCLGRRVLFILYVVDRKYVILHFLDSINRQVWKVKLLLMSAAKELTLILNYMLCYVIKSFIVE